VKAIISKIVHLDDEAAINGVYIRPNGKIGYHQAVVYSCFYCGRRRLQAESDEKRAIKAGQAIFWEARGYESGTETGMTAVIVRNKNRPG
jgi:hypothetical protein